MSDWTPSSWKVREAAQLVAYPSEAEVDRTLEEMAKLPPLVTSWEVLELKSQLADAASGGAPSAIAVRMM